MNHNSFLFIDVFFLFKYVSRNVKLKQCFRRKTLKEVVLSQKVKTYYFKHDYQYRGKNINSIFRKNGFKQVK